MSPTEIVIGGQSLGDKNPAYVIAEIGINHNGDVELAKSLIDVAQEAGCQAVKFQKRSPDLSTPESQKSKLRDTPWGTMTYLDYKRKVEFESMEYEILSDHAARAGLQWFASPWDIPSVEFLESHNVPAHKIASACITDILLLKAIAETGKPVIMSTGMSTIAEIDKAVEILGSDNLVIMHSTSTYPLNPEEANLRMIGTLKDRYGVPVGYSGHETGLQVSLAAVTLGAVAIERHVTLDRAMWGSDHAASLEPNGLKKLIRDIRIVESALGDGIKKVYPSEQPSLDKLRK